MSHKPQIVAGDDCDAELTLLGDDGEAQDLTGASSVKFAIVSLDRTRMLAGPYTCDENYATSNWSEGQIVVALVGAETDTIEDPYVAIETQVVLAGRKTTYVNTQPVAVIKGLIA